MEENVHTALRYKSTVSAAANPETPFQLKYETRRFKSFATDDANNTAVSYFYCQRRTEDALMTSVFFIIFMSSSSRSLESF